MSPSPSALSGITVLDLSRVLAGPYASMLLGDLGADVIKIERPDGGDDTRHWGPPFTESGQSAYFLCANRNKRSVTLNLNTHEGRRLVRKMVPRCDVLLENFRAGAMERWGIGYDELRALNPGLVYCSITGYGQTGPYWARPGYDNVIEAQGGIMSITGPPGESGVPYKVGVAIVDITAGLYAAFSILAALRHRDLTGSGQMIDVALYDVQLSWLANVASGYLVSGEPPQRHGNAHPSIVPYQAVAASDGWLMLAVGNDRQFASLCDLLDHPEWAQDAKYATNAARVANREGLMRLIEAAFRTRTTGEWAGELLRVGVPCGPVNDVPAALNDPQTHAREMVQSVLHPDAGPIPQIGPAIKFSASPPRIRTAPPLLGEHTDEVLREFLGCTDRQIAEFRMTGVI